MHFRTLFLLLLLKTVSSLNAQLPPSSIYILDILSSADSQWIVTKVSYISHFNSKAYNNQVQFISSNELLASIRLEGSNNNEIFRFDLNKKTYTNLSNSTASEYSPRLSPFDKQHIHCISVPKEDSTIQDLVEMDLNNGKYTKRVFNKFAKIGYYRHFKDKLWICYLVEEPHVLSICDEGLMRKKIFASGIGRTFEVFGENEILFVHKITNEQWILKAYNVKTEKSRTITQMPTGSEDFTLDESGNIYCAIDSKLLRLSSTGTWETLIDLISLKIRNINRLALYQNKLALVSLH